MDRRDWSPPAVERPQGKARAPGASDAKASSPPPAAQWMARFILCMAFFGVIGALSSSWFPICVGAVLFFTGEDFIEWALQTIGIRLVPDTPGAVFVKTLVLLVGWSILLASWKDAAPGWLSSQLPSEAPPWSFAIGGALLFAVLSTASAAIMTSLLPEIRRGSLAWTTTRALIALAMFGMLALFTYAFGPLQARVGGEFPQAIQLSRAAARIGIGATSMRRANG